MSVVTDQAGRAVEITGRPRRIISLVPSQTELLADLGLDADVIGITKFCIHPDEWFHSKTRVGGTKNVHADRVAALQPDLILANKEENVKEQIEALSATCPVWVSDINTMQDALDMITQVGRLTGTEERAAAIRSGVETGFATLPVPPTKPRAAYLIWKDPYMTAGGDTFIHAMLDAAGFTNCFHGSSRYPVVTTEQLAAAQCEVLLLSSEPYPFKQIHVDELQAQLPGTRVVLVDGEMFSWYGSRLLKAPSYFERLAGLVAQAR
ncbi:MAG: cobalamin-binding protein [Flaviaesturariibacter sp.]|nr:cobalamin-binding protein [Flaviaesturariibacter sp.]